MYMLHNLIKISNNTNSYTNNMIDSFSNFPSFENRNIFIKKLHPLNIASKKDYFYGKNNIMHGTLARGCH